MGKEHHYSATIEWTGNNGTGTDDYRHYERSHVIRIPNKPDIQGSSDAPFRGDITKHNPEDFLLSSLSVCHMLWYLHLCADAGVVVTAYVDRPTGVLTQTENGSGKFTSVTLNPLVTVASQDMIERAEALHKKANEFCFIANSVNFPVGHKPVIVTA